MGFLIIDFTILCFRLPRPPLASKPPGSQWPDYFNNWLYSCKLQNVCDSVYILLFICFLCMSRFLLILSYCVIFSSLWIIFFPTWYVFDVAISFLPYLIVLYTFFVWYWIAQCIFVRLYWQYVVFVFVFLFFALKFTPIITHFYQGLTAPSIYKTGDVRVLYANIRKDNVDYSWLLAMVDKYDPDMVLFVEFADHHDIHMKSYFSKKYPYINRTTWSQKFIWSIVFSKIPITNLADKFPQGAWRYGYFSIDLGNHPYYLYLVHTSSPTSPFNADMRNNQFASVIHDMQIHEKKFPRADILLLGDFNVTPWSIFYQQFVAQLPYFTDITNRFSLLFTWRLYWFPLFRAHIDHIFTNQPSFINSLQSISVPGSDHRGYMFTIMNY